MVIMVRKKGEKIFFKIGKKWNHVVLVFVY
jgi:hypothetical protein